MSDESNGVTIRPMSMDDLKQMQREHEELNPNRPIRPDTIESLQNYVNHGLEPGGFLMAVLENNLMEAMGRADSYNRATLWQICGYVYNDMPSHSHGSPEIVNEWLQNFRGAK